MLTRICRNTLLMLPLMVCTTLSLSAADQVNVLPVSEWQLKCRKGDKVELRDDEGFLGIHYDLNVDQTFRLGHITFKQGNFRILLKRPVILRDDQTRVIFEAKGFIKQRNRIGFIQMMPLIKDQSGEILIYEPYPYPHLNNCTQNWCTWTSRYFYGAEAGGATQNIFQPDYQKSGDGNSWPNGKLTFIGFDIQVRPKKFGPVKGSLYLGPIRFAGMKIPYQHPFAYADSILKNKGTYQFSANARNNYQKLPVREWQQTINYDPESLRSQHQRINVPLGPDDNYWISYQITDQAGRIIEQKQMRYEVAGNPDTKALKTVDANQVPAIGFLRINPGRDAVYKQNETMDVKVKLFFKNRQKLTLKWHLTPYAKYYSNRKLKDQVIESGEETRQKTKRGFADLDLNLKGKPGRDAYRLMLDVYDGDKLVDAQEYVLGRKTDLNKARNSRQGLIRGRDYVKKTPYFRTTFKYANDATSEDDYVKRFETYLDQASQMTPYLTFSVLLDQFEILPGVYDFAILDRVMDAAADRGCTMTVRFIQVESYGQLKWPKYSKQVNYDGSIIHNHFYGNYQAADSKYLSLFQRAQEAVYKRYKTHPAFQGYYLMESGGESMILDKPWLGVVSGYSKVANLGFRDYLKDELRLDLNGLNKRWGTSFSSWDQVATPLPDFKTGTKPDTRLQWLDFCRYKNILNESYWYQSQVDKIRSYDKQRVIIVYAPHTWEGMLGKVDYSHGGGVPHMAGNLSKAYIWDKYRIGAIQEPHHPFRWNSKPDIGFLLDWNLYAMMSHAGMGGLNYHVYYNPQRGTHGPLLSGYGNMWDYDRFERFKTIHRELFPMTLLSDAKVQVATYSDPTTLFTKHRTVFPYRLGDLSRWFELLIHGGISHETFRKERIAEYKLLLPNLLDEVLSKDSVDLLDSYVRNGGKTIISAITGRYCPEIDNKPFPLLRKLGIQPPKGKFVFTGNDVNAESINANPFFGKGEKIHFFTLDNLKNDPYKEEIAKNFFQWPFRWIPQTDYFGYYPENKETNGEVLARFDNGGVAVSKHKVGKGDVIVFWGIPDYTAERMTPFMKRVAKWAGIEQKTSDNPLPLMMEGQVTAKDLPPRHYAVVWNGAPRRAGKPGTYIQKIPAVPDGKWFVEDIVSTQRYGLFTADELRKKGVPLTFHKGQSPLQVLRMVNLDKEPKAPYMNDYIHKEEATK